MKTFALIIALEIVCRAASLAGELVILGPHGGRVLVLDSTTIPNVEYLVNKERRLEIALLDRKRKAIQPSKQKVSVSLSRPYSNRVIDVEVKKRGGVFFTDPIPEGRFFTISIAVTATPGARSVSAHADHDETLMPSGKPRYLDVSANEGKGALVGVPDPVDEVFIEIAKVWHQLEWEYINEDYGKLEERAEALCALLKALPGKAGDKAQDVRPMVDAMLKDVASLMAASAGRAVRKATENVFAFKAKLMKLQAMVPSQSSYRRIVERDFRYRTE
jgi:hypothetical protein